MGKSKIPLIDRFWQRVNKNGPTVRAELGPCWVWDAGKQSDNYGTIKDAGIRYVAHRLSWELHNTTIPYGLWVLHRCDNPPCVRPDHLFLGTRQDNMDDMKAKGRQRKGSPMTPRPAPCECGCGKDAGLWPESDRSKGRTRGEPKRFIHGHSLCLTR